MPLRDAILQRRITAWHEAAHAVVAFRFGIRVDELAICHGGRIAGYVQMISKPLIVNKGIWNDVSSRLTWAIVKRDTEHHAMVLLAGPLAEAKLFGTFLRAHCCESDLDRCETLCALLAVYRRHLATTQGLLIPEELPSDMASRLRRRTRRMLGHPHVWRAVRALAEDLEGWSKLTGYDAADTVQWTKRIQNQLSLLLPMPERHGPSPPSQTNRKRRTFPKRPAALNNLPWTTRRPMAAS